MYIRSRDIHMFLFIEQYLSAHQGCLDLIIMYCRYLVDIYHSGVCCGVWLAVFFASLEIPFVLLVYLNLHKPICDEERLSNRRLRKAST